MSDYEVTSGPHRFVVMVRDADGGMQVTIDGRVHRVEMHRWVPPTHFVMSVDGISTPVAVERMQDELRVVVGWEQYRLQVARRLPIQRGGASGGSGSTDIRIVAPMPGLIVAVQARPGALVEQGATVVIMEAMKMQMEIRAPRAGRLSGMSVKPGEEVAKGQTLATITSTQSPPSAQSPQSTDTDVL